jgi:hypothetical protein
MDPERNQHDPQPKPSKYKQVSCNPAPAQGAQLDEDEIRRRILELKKQKKGTTFWSYFSSPLAIAAVFSMLAAVVVFLTMIPEDSRFYKNSGRRAHSSDRPTSDFIDDDYSDDQLEMLEQQQQLQRQQEERRRFNSPGSEDLRFRNEVEDDDLFYKSSESGLGDEGDEGDDYSPWNEKSPQRVEPAHSRTHRVVQQRIVPPQQGERIQV